ncbi:MAG: peptidase S41, partial [Bacteroidota bacterium]
WNSFGQGGTYELVVSPEARTGEQSVLIAHEEGDEGFRAWGQNVKPNFGGKKLKLTGYLRSENVSDGFAGLWLRIDPNVGFDNMADRGVTGTNDWQRFEVELDYDENAAENIAFGGLLVGKGKVWIDDLELTIDGKPFDEAPAPEILPAKLDTAFDRGSGVEFPAPWSAPGTRDLALLGKVWGVLKYYHPDVASGKYNWDYELFRALPGFLAAKDKSAFLSEWVVGYGKPDKCETCAPPPDAAVVADHRWLDGEGVSVELRDQLRYLIDNRPLFERHYYVGAAPGIGNPSFKNEASYKDRSFPDAGFRYLAAVRYWNIIHYYFPYRNEMDVDWNDALAANNEQFLQL